MQNTSKDFFNYDIANPMRTSLESSQGPQTPRDGAYNTCAPSASLASPHQMTPNVLPPIGEVPVCRRNGSVVVSTLRVATTPQTPPQSTHPLLQSLASHVHEMPLAAAESTSFPGDCFSFSPSMDKVFWDPSRPPILPPMPMTVPPTKPRSLMRAMAQMPNGSRRLVSIFIDDKYSVRSTVADSPSGASTMSEQSDREMSAASSPVSSRASSPSLEDNEAAPSMRVCGSGLMMTDKMKKAESTSPGTCARKSRLRNKEASTSLTPSSSSPDSLQPETAVEEVERQGAAAAGARGTEAEERKTAIRTEPTEEKEDEDNTSAVADGEAETNSDADDNWLGGGGGGGGAADGGGGEGSTACEQCMQSLRDAPIVNTRMSRKKPISSVQKDRTRRLFQSYLQKHKESSANEKAAFFFANFTLCGGFKRLRQLVGYHNKQHATRAGATKITRHMDSKLQVLRECAADSTIPLWLFLNAKKPGSETRKPAKQAAAGATGSGSGSDGGGEEESHVHGPVRNTGKNRKRNRDRPYP